LLSRMYPGLLPLAIPSPSPLWFLLLSHPLHPPTFPLPTPQTILLVRVRPDHPGSHIVPRMFLIHWSPHPRGRQAAGDRPGPKAQHCEAHGLTAGPACASGTHDLAVGLTIITCGPFTRTKKAKLTRRNARSRSR
jgi:hypothetical protein